MITAPTLSSSRLSTRPVTVSPVSCGGELEHLAGDRGLEAVDAGDAVAHLEHGADLVDVVRAEVRRLDLAEQDVLELAGTEGRVSGHEFECPG